MFASQSYASLALLPRHCHLHCTPWPHNSLMCKQPEKLWGLSCCFVALPVLKLVLHLIFCLQTYHISYWNVTGFNWSLFMKIKWVHWKSPLKGNHWKKVWYIPWQNPEMIYIQCSADSIQLLSTGENMFGKDELQIRLKAPDLKHN